MTEKDIRDKITQLRVEHNHLSEYQLSLDLGQSKVISKELPPDGRCRR